MIRGIVTPIVNLTTHAVKAGESHSRGENTLYAELLDLDNIRLHTSGGGSYDPKQPRSEDDGTIDEVYRRGEPLPHQ